MSDDGIDAVDAQAIAAFGAEHSGVSLGPVVVVIAAYDEGANIGPVVASIPRSLCGLHADVLVVDDGSSDQTGRVARDHGAYVCAPTVNRGQGAALRLGYHLAKDRGARFIATTDADGQYEAAELALILQPLVEGSADFVTGSRRLGLYTTDDVVRHTGVRVFATLMSLLTRRRVTDTSNGLRAFRAEVINHLTLAEPQYQATELLIGVYYRGFRVLEIGTTLNQRRSGKSKKGPNLVYGYRFGRVILRTWWRELRRNRRDGRRLFDPSPLAGGEAAYDDRPASPPNRRWKMRYFTRKDSP